MAQISDKAKSIIASVAPALATALGGPLAGLAVKAIADKLVGNPEASADEVSKAVVGATPDQLLALKHADNDFAKRMRELDIDLERIAMQDRDSARRREFEAGDSWTPRILASVVVAGFLFAVWMVLSGKVSGLQDATMAATIGTLIGYVSAKADQVVSYYFGSSAGSARKDRVLIGRR